MGSRTYHHNLRRRQRLRNLRDERLRSALLSVVLSLTLEVEIVELLSVMPALSSSCERGRILKKL